MGTIPLPALNVRQPEQPDLLGNLGRLAGLKQAQQQIQSGQLENQQRQMQIDQTQRDQADAQAIQQTLASNPGATYGDVLPMLRGKIQPKTWATLVEADQKIKKGYSDQTKADLDNAEAQHKQYGEIYNNVMNMPDQQVAANWPQIAQAVDAIPGNKIKLDPQQPLTKQQLSQYGPMLSLNESYLKAEQDKRSKAAEEWKDAGLGLMMNVLTGETKGNLRQPVEQQELSDWMAKNPGKGPSDFMKYQKTIVPQFKFQMGGGDAKDQARSDKSYQFHSGQLDKVGKPVEDAVTRLGRLQDTLAQNSPQADALVAPELLTVMAGGQGSGLRMNEAEISRIVGGRSNWETLKASINKWSSDPSKANSITPSQRQQIRSLVGVVAGKLQAKQKVMDDARQSLINANDPEEHKKILYEARKKLSDIDSQAGGGVQVTDPRNVVHTFPDQASADKFKKLAGIQ